MTIIFKKSFLRCKEVKEFVRKSQLDEFKRRILEHLEQLEAKEKKKDEKVQKALVERERMRKAGFPVGTVREWKGKKYMKVAPNKWRPKYDSDTTRGARQSIAAIKKKVSACTTTAELLQVVKENKHRFTDENGKYLPFVKEMFEHVARKKKEIRGAKGAGQAASGSVGSGGSASSGGSNGSGASSGGSGGSSGGGGGNNNNNGGRGAAAGGGDDDDDGDGNDKDKSGAGGSGGGDDGGDGESGKKKDNQLKPATKEELRQFLFDAVTTTENRRISLGEIGKEAKQRIKKVLKEKKGVNRIVLDSGQIRHAMRTPDHLLKLSDLEKIKDIVDTTRKISLSAKEHRYNKVLRFVEEVENGIILVLEFRRKQGDLSLVTAYRKEGQRQRWTKTPAHTSETFHTAGKDSKTEEPLTGETSATASGGNSTSELSQPPNTSADVTVAQSNNVVKLSPKDFLTGQMAKVGMDWQFLNQIRANAGEHDREMLGEMMVLINWVRNSKIANKEALKDTLLEIAACASDIGERGKLPNLADFARNVNDYIKRHFEEEDTTGKSSADPDIKKAVAAALQRAFGNLGKSA